LLVVSPPVSQVWFSRFDTICHRPQGWV